MWIQSLHHRLPQIYISYLEPIITLRKKGKPDADTMGGNTSLQVTQKECFAHGQILLKWTTSDMESVNNISHQRYLETFCMIRV